MTDRREPPVPATVPATRKDERKNRKALIGAVAAGTAGVLVLGLGYAFFSDTVLGTASATAGTLDLTGDLKVTHNGSAVEGTSIGNLNPGDTVEISGDITNAGNKSAWARSLVQVTAEDGLDEYLYVFTDGGDATAQDRLLAKTPAELVTAGGTLVGADGAATVGSTPVIVNGTGTGAETETDGQTGFTADVVLYFAKEAPNAAQGAGLSTDVAVQAIQYRNNTGTPDADDWDAVVSTEFGS